MFCNDPSSRIMLSQQYIRYTRCLLLAISILVAVLSLSGYRYLGDGGIDRREILHDGKYWFWTDLLPFWGGTLRGPKSEILGLNFRQFDRIYLENSKSQCYISIRA